MKVKYRIIFSFLVILLLYAGLGTRLFFIQITSHKRFSEIARKNYSIQINKISPQRGEIYDRNGVPLAVNKHTYSVGFNKNYGIISEAMLEDLAALLDLGTGKVREKLEGSTRFTWLRRHVDPDKVEPLFKHKEDGLVIVKENSRYYPKAPSSGQIVGCVGTDNQGLSGIEFNFDKQLKGSAKKQKLVRDARGRVIHLSTLKENRSNNQCKIELTIDSNLQYIVERELMRGYFEYKPKWAMAVVQDPNSGEILAMSVFPSLDNDSVMKNVKDLNNMAISSIFEPGSTFKIVTGAAALQEGVIEIEENINCEGGEYEVGGFPIRDFEPHDSLSFSDCIVYSSNIGLAKIGAKLGERQLYKYARDFGFGNFTGIRLPGESRGILRKPDRWSGTSVSRISFGQEIGVTAIQLVGAFSVIANGGVLYEPRIVRSIEVSGRPRKFAPLPIRRVISEDTAKTMNGIMQAVVERGSGVKARMGGFKVAGKTGTAQKYNEETLSYAENKYVALFGGFVPADDPKLAIVVIFDEPDESLYWGGYVAAPVFSSIASRCLSYMNIPPSEPLEIN